MYDLVRQKALDRARWKEDGSNALPLQFLEAYRHQKDTEATDDNCTTGSLSSETELQRWLSRTAAATHPTRGKLLGSIRLLVCDRTQYTPLDFSLSRQAFESIEKMFELSPLTVPSLESEAGTYSRFLVHRADDRSKLRRIHTMLKAPQKREILNWGLSLSYDVETGATTGFLYGTGLGILTLDRNYDLQHSAVHSPIGSFVRSIQAAIAQWDHPMLLPCLFLSEHLSRINIFCTQGKVMSETVSIEHQLGVTKVGQSAYLTKEAKASNLSRLDSTSYIQPTGNPDNPFLPGVGSARFLSREETEDLTVRINTQSTRVAFTARSPEWNLACARFLLKTMADTERYLAHSHAQSQHECEQLLEHNITLAEAAASNIAVIKERMALQLDVLYNFVAQLDNQTTAELAASASRDSTSMKILAFISALFLPGNFVSAMFSMDMFNWNGPSKFWIYWAATVPLTAVTIMGWAAWWYFELGRFDRKIKGIRARPPAKTAAKQGP